MLIHQAMIERLISAHGCGHSLEEANNIVKLEIERICRSILINTAVYKDNDIGNKGFIDFMLSNDLYLI